MLSIEAEKEIAFLRGWRNECLRVFYDRLICDPDRVLVEEQFQTIVQQHFPSLSSSIIQNPLLYAIASPSLLASFSIFLQEETNQFREVKDFEEARERFEKALEAHNQKEKPMRLVLFDYAVDRLTRILRTLRLPRVSFSFLNFVHDFNQGHALLVGIGGLGKKSLARLAAFVCQCSVFEITLTRGYGEQDFKEDLKKLHILLGIENQKVKLPITSSKTSFPDFLPFRRRSCRRRKFSRNDEQFVDNWNRPVLVRRLGEGNFDPTYSRRARERQRSAYQGTLLGSLFGSLS